MTQRVYVGIVENMRFDFRTMVTAESQEEAREKVLEKFRKEYGVFFQEDDLQVVLFTDLV